MSHDDEARCGVTNLSPIKTILQPHSIFIGAEQQSHNCYDRHSRDRMVQKPKGLVQNTYYSSYTTNTNQVVIFPLDRCT